MKIIIIEDEPRTASDIEQMLTEIDPAIKVITKLDSVESSIEYFSEGGSPELVFMDIQLADGLSFEIFQKVKIDCPVIFLTAFDQYAIEAFKVNGIDYILKPFDKKTLSKALEKYGSLSSHFSGKASINNEIAQLLKNYKQPVKSIYLVSSGEKYFPVSVNDIALFYIDNGVTYIHTFAGKKHSISQTLEEIEQNVDGKLFYRANRQNLVNFSAIREIEHYFNRKLALKLTVQFKNTIEISKTKATDFLNWMENR